MFILINTNGVLNFFKGVFMYVPTVIEKSANGERAYDLYSRLLKDRVIFINGDFDEHMANIIVAQLLWLEANDCDAPINLYVNSCGGSISAMLTIYDTMNYIKCPVGTVGYGTVASAATFIVAAGEPGQRFALPNTEFMIHELSSGAQGKYTDINNSHKHLKRLHETLIDGYVKSTGQKKKKLIEDMKVDFYMTAEEARDYGSKGLIDDIQVKSFR
jgi:ATP-dependent Clp protease protease subunit